MVRTAAVIVSLAIVAAACGGKSSPPQTASEEKTAEPVTAEPAAPAAAGGFVEVTFARMREYKASVCACQDKACADDAQQALMDWAMKHMEDLKDLKPTDAQNAEADKLQSEI